MAELLALDAFVLPAELAPRDAPSLRVRDSAMMLLPPPRRAWIVASIERATIGAALDRVTRRDFEPYAQGVIVSNDDRALEALEALERATPGVAGECTIARYERAVVELRCDAHQAGLVVVSELFADGWTATLDDRSVPLVPVDVVLRGLPIAPGDHRIVMRYETPGFGEGALVSAASALLLLLGFVLSRDRQANVAPRAAV
jgi:hypothetical protein